MERQSIFLRVHLFGRWIITRPSHPEMAWSGSQWVPLMGTVQICNFLSPLEALRYYIEASEIHATSQRRTLSANSS